MEPNHCDHLLCVLLALLRYHSPGQPQPALLVLSASAQWLSLAPFFNPQILDFGDSFTIFRVDSRHNNTIRAKNFLSHTFRRSHVETKKSQLRKYYQRRKRRSKRINSSQAHLSGKTNEALLPSDIYIYRTRVRRVLLL